MNHFEPLTDLQWQLIEPLFPKPEKRGRGKPHTPWRAVMNSILLVLVTKTKWGALPQESDFASKSASHRWFVIWKENGFLDTILGKLQELKDLASEISFPARRMRMPKAAQELEVMAAVS
jgi:transposase